MKFTLGNAACVHLQRELTSELQSEEVRVDVESRWKQVYWQLKLDWLNKNVGGKIKTGMVGMVSCFLPLIDTSSTKHKQEHKLRLKSCWWRDTWKHGTPSWSTKRASWHTLIRLKHPIPTPLFNLMIAYWFIIYIHALKSSMDRIKHFHFHQIDNQSIIWCI